MRTRVLDSYILTFKDNTEPIVLTNQEGKIVTAKWLRDLFNEVELLNVEPGNIEIAVPIWQFLRVFETRRRELEIRSSTLVRLRTSPMTILGKLSYPIRHIDNKIEWQDKPTAESVPEPEESMALNFPNPS